VLLPTERVHNGSNRTGHRIFRHNSDLMLRVQTNADRPVMRGLLPDPFPNATDLLGTGPGVAWPKSRCSGCEPAALATESFPWCPARRPLRPPRSAAARTQPMLVAAQPEPPRPGPAPGPAAPQAHRSPPPYASPYAGPRRSSLPPPAAPFPARLQVTAAGMPYFGSLSVAPLRATPRQNPTDWHLVNKPGHNGRQAVRARPIGPLNATAQAVTPTSNLRAGWRWRGIPGGG
jgi:hypothetical protein